LYPRNSLALLLSAALALAPAGMGQQVSGPSSKLVAPTGGLKIVVLQGEGAINNISAKTATQPVVEVRDENDKPVAGVEVIFSLPAAGPGGVFHGWLRTQTAKTNAEGQASVSGLTPNDQPGRFNIKVTATSGNKTASVVIAQNNAQRGGAGGRAAASSSRKWKVAGLLGAAAVIGGIVAAKRGGNGTTTTTVTTPVTLTPGPVTVAGPR
jgi:hypothetical protein